MTEQTIFQDARRYLAMLHKRRGLIVTCVVSSLVVAFIYVYTTRPLYQATAQLLIERDMPKVLPTKDVLEVSQSTADYYQTQHQLLRGRTLAEKAVERINFQKSAELQTGPLMSPLERLRARLLGRAPRAIVDSDGVKLSPAVAAFRSRLVVAPVPGTRLVNVRFSAYDPALAALAANTVVQAYIEQSLEYRFSTSTEASGWLSQRLQEQQQEVEAAERKVQQYREKEGLLNFEERQSLADQKLSSLTVAALNARTERITKETLYNQIRSLSPTQLESFPAILGNPVIQGLRTQLADLQREHVRLAETLGEKHPDMIRARSQIRATEEKMRAETANLARSIESDYLTARQQEASLQANVEDAKREVLELNRRAIDLGVLTREVKTKRGLIDNLSTRRGEADLAGELKSTNIQINERAERGVLVSPNKTRAYLMAFLLGLSLGIGLTLLFEHMDNTLKTPEDVKQFLGLPFLGVVPDVAARGGGNNPARPSPIILKNPHSSIAEAYRVLRTNLMFSLAETSGRVVVVTSANPGEGKTTTTANLAASLAQTGATVLAVEADLRRPSLYHQLGVGKTPGLTDLIVGKCDVSQAIQKTRFRNLMVLPCGYLPPNPAELLGSSRMRDEIVRALRAHYDWVLFDTPPILAMADTAVLCPMADGIVLVVAAEESHRPALLRAVDQVQSVGGKIIGVVLNKVDLERNSYYYGQYYGEYYRSYYAEGAGRYSAQPTSDGVRPAQRAARRN
jgi:polysaccharide biosynthesis transport protein